jgi:hypothetical protein
MASEADANLMTSDSSSPDAWRASLTVGWRKCVGGVASECWLRWTSPRGLYYWLHPTENRWVSEPEQITMPTFSTAEEAWAAFYSVAKPTIE